jgi:hypothetical protein
VHDRRVVRVEVLQRFGGLFEVADHKRRVEPGAIL